MTTDWHRQLDRHQQLALCRGWCDVGVYPDTLVDGAGSGIPGVH